MLALPNNLNVIDKLQGRKGISQGLIWIENYNKILNSKNKHIGAGWYRPTFIDGLLTIKKTLHPFKAPLSGIQKAHSIQLHPQ